jgi:hypothetical protein
METRSPPRLWRQVCAAKSPLTRTNMSSDQLAKIAGLRETTAANALGSSCSARRSWTRAGVHAALVLLMLEAASADLV